MRFIYMMDKIGKTLPRAPVAVVLYAVFFLSGRAAEASTAGGSERAGLRAAAVFLLAGMLPAAKSRLVRKARSKRPRGSAIKKDAR